MKRFLPYVLLTFGTVVLSGCFTTMAGVRTEPIDRGVAKVYEADLETAVRSTRKALLGVRSATGGSALRIDDIRELYESTWMFLAITKAEDAFVRVIVQETAENEITIRVLSKRRDALALMVRFDWSPAVFAQLALDLTEKQRPS